MSALDWIFTSFFLVTYVFLVFTVCVMTFQKGHIVLGIVGIFVPFLWLIGAILPPRPGSPYAAAESRRHQESSGYMAS
jgi:hypothetical protein